MKNFILAVSASLVLIALALFLNGCSTYGRHEGTEPDLIGEPPMRSGSDPIPGDGCVPGTCCVLGSCQPHGCADGMVCINAVCIDVLKVCGGVK